MCTYQAIHQFLNNLRESAKHAIAAATLKLDSGNLIIQCPNHALFEQIAVEVESVSKAASDIEWISRITLVSPKKKVGIHIYYPVLDLPGKQLDQVVIDQIIGLLIKELPVLNECQLSQIVRESGKIALKINCSTRQIADALYVKRHVINRALAELGLPPRTDFYLRENLFGTSSITSPINMNPNNFIIIPSDVQARIKNYEALIKGIPGVAVSLHDANEKTGFMYLDIHAPIKERLNKQPKELILRPVSVLPSELSEIRQHLIKRALANAQNEKGSYVYDWEGLRWKFDVSAIPLYGTEEVIAVVTDPPSESWQLGYWLNRI